MKIVSNSFQDGGEIKARHAMKAIQGGENISPHISISDLPAGTAALALACIDRHPRARGWVHWLAVNVPPQGSELAEGASPGSMPAGSIELMNSFGTRGYGGPQPPRGSGRHQYEFTAYALNGPVTVKNAQQGEMGFLELARGKILAKASISAFFENK